MLMCVSTLIFLVILGLKYSKTWTDKYLISCILYAGDCPVGGADLFIFCIHLTAAEATIFYSSLKPRYFLLLLKIMAISHIRISKKKAE